MANWNALTWSETVETGKDGLRHMLTMLCLKCTDEYRVFSTKKRLGAFMELSERNVGPRISQLEEQGLVTQIRRVRPNGSEAKPITLLNHPDAPHMQGRPIVLDYEGKYLYPREPQALRNAGVCWVAGGVEGGVQPKYALTSNADQHVDSSSHQHDDSSCCQHDDSTPHVDDESSPPKHSPLEAVPSSSLGSTDEDAPTPNEPEQQEEEDVSDETDHKPPPETELFDSYVRFRAGKYLRAESRERCLELLAAHRLAGWSDATLAAYLRDWSAEAHNPSTYLLDKLGGLSAPQTSVPRIRPESSARAERPAPASEETRRQAKRAFRLGRRGGGAA